MHPERGPPGNAKDGAWTNSIGVAWELVKKANYRPYPGNTEPGTLRVEPTRLCLTSPLLHDEAYEALLQTAGSLPGMHIELLGNF